MLRRALIITNAGEPKERGTKKYCEGVHMDVDLYRDFLKSPFGGLWEPEEIHSLNRPDVSEVEAELDRLRRVDYSFVVYSGHGYHDGKSTILAFKRGVELDSVRLRAGASKHTLILDCCRVIERPTRLSEQMAKAIQTRPRVNRADCRAYFDNLIEQCPKGPVVAFACSRNERSGDDADSGGYYSASLIETAEEWIASKAGGLHLRMQRSPDYLSIVDAHFRAVPKVEALSNGRQHPSVARWRTEPYFPFCVVAFA
jgi:hypothetical protein